MMDLVTIGLFSKKLYNIKRHTHMNWELVYYTSGSGVLDIAGRRIAFGANDFVIQPPYLPHGEHSDCGYSNIYLIFSDFPNSSKEPQVFHDTASKSFLSTLLQLHREYYAKKNNCVNLTGALMNVLFQYIVSFQQDKGENHYVEQFINTLVANFSNSRFTIDDALKTTPISADYFRRLFKKETDRTPIAYLTDLRIGYAKKLLCDRSMAIKEIAMLAGFDDPYYFSRLFKQQTGKAPSDWYSA